MNTQEKLQIREIEKLSENTKYVVYSENLFEGRDFIPVLLGNKLDVSIFKTLYIKKEYENYYFIIEYKYLDKYEKSEVEKYENEIEFKYFRSDVDRMKNFIQNFDKK